MFYLNDCGVTCALGLDRDAVRGALLDAKSGVLPTGEFTPGRVLPLGRVPAGALPPVAHLPIAHRSRNHRLALAALAQIRPSVDAAIARYGADRVAVVIGTSTSGIAETEAALLASNGGALPESYHYGQQELGTAATALAAELGVGGPAYVHSTACSSSAKAMASSARLLAMGLVDAVVTGGVDSLCGFTIAGFSALESVSAERCNPLSANRHGINIGEGAALFLMTREAAAVRLAGWGEASDGHHISAPDPEGHGARLAITQALARAGVQPHEVDYINLHGTATPQNDAMESKVVASIFGGSVPVSSTKPMTGHALGAAGAIEAALCWLLMQADNPQGVLPPHLWDGQADPALPALAVVAAGGKLGRPLRTVVSNSFAFGGSNAVLVLGANA